MGPINSAKSQYCLPYTDHSTPHKPLTASPRTQYQLTQSDDTSPKHLSLSKIAQLQQTPPKSVLHDWKREKLQWKSPYRIFDGEICFVCAISPRPEKSSDITVTRCLYLCFSLLVTRGPEGQLAASSKHISPWFNNNQNETIIIRHLRIN